MQPENLFVTVHLTVTQFSVCASFKWSTNWCWNGLATHSHYVRAVPHHHHQSGVVLAFQSLMLSVLTGMVHGLLLYRGIMSCHGVTSSCLGNSICRSTASDIYVYKWECSYSFIKVFLASSHLPLHAIHFAASFFWTPYLITESMALIPQSSTLLRDAWGEIYMLCSLRLW